MALQRGLDLVLIAPKANPPVCKIMDYGKYRYTQIKKQKETKKKQKVVEVKELRFSMNIDTNDLRIKAKQALKFLNDGNKIRVSIRLRGREMAKGDLAFGVLEDFYKLVEEHAQIEKPAERTGRQVGMVIGPISQKKK